MSAPKEPGVEVLEVDAQEQMANSKQSMEKNHMVTNVGSITELPTFST